MGNCGSDQIHFAISQDGEENVKQAAILSANQTFIDSLVEKTKPTYQEKLTKKLQYKIGQVTDARKTINQKFQEKKLTLQMEETGTVQYLASKHSTSFQSLSGYAEAMSKLQEFQKNVKHIYAAQAKKIPDDIDKYKEDLKFELEKLKQPLPALMALGISQKDKVLIQVAKHHPQDVQVSNKKLEEKFNEQFAFDEIYRKRCQEWVPKSEIDRIVVNFETTLATLHTKKSNKNAFLGCF